MPGVFLTTEQTDKFKTAILSVSLLRPLRAQDASLGALLPSVLLRGTERYPDMARISAHLDRLYGAGFGGVVRKKGETQTVGFYADFIEDELAPGNEPVLREMTQFLGEVLLHPYLRGGVFSEEYVMTERLNLINTIASRINDKRQYAVSGLVRAMCAGEAYGVDRLGSEETAAAITPETLYAYYHSALRTSRYELFYCGRADHDMAAALLREALADLPARAPEPVGTVVSAAPAAVRRVTERLDVTQGKLAIGLRTGITADKPGYPAMTVLNAVFGGGVSSKLFRNVREALSLCYYASSALEKLKGVMVVSSGVEFENLSRAETEILRQLEACRAGDITDEELELARRYVISSLRAGEDSPGRLEDFALGQAIAGLDGTMAELRAGVQAATKEQVVEAARSLTLDTVFELRGETA